MDQYEEEMKKIAINYPNLHVLQRAEWIHPSGISFYGCTLWDHNKDNLKNEIIKLMNDYTQIYFEKNLLFNPDYANMIHAKDKEWLEKMINKNQSCVIVTHHIPSYKNTIEDILKDVIDFEKDGILSYLMKDNVKLWICGHSHYQTMTQLNSVPLVINAIGYPNELNFDMSKTFNVFT